VSAPPDQQDLIALFREAVHLMVDLGNERTGRVHDLHAPRSCDVTHSRRYPVRREHNSRSVRHLIEFVDEDCATLLEVRDHVAVMDDLAPDVHGGSEALDGTLDRLDGTLHAGTERAWPGEQHARAVCPNFWDGDHDATYRPRAMIGHTSR
jgi:hypothetical protein